MDEAGAVLGGLPIEPRNIPSPGRPPPTGYTPTAVIVQRAIVWGGTGGVGWGAYRYVETGLWFTGEIVVFTALVGLMAAGVFTLAKFWRVR